MFTIDFTKPWLYKDIIYFNQGNLSTNNTLRCKLVTGGSDDFTGGSIACTFTTKDSIEISGFGKLIDAKNGIIDIVFPSNSLVVGTNKLEVLVNRADGGVAQSPPVIYDIWQGLTTGNGVEAETNYPILIELINSTNEASNKANLALNKANSMITDITDAIDNAYRSANEADIATSNANAKIEEVKTSKLEMIKKVDNSIANMKVETNTAINSMASKTDEKIADVDRALAAGTKDLEVKESRRDMDGVEHDTLKLRLESDLKKGKVIEETKEGTYLSFNDTVRGIVSDIEVLGNTVQDASNLASIRSSCIPNGDGTFKMSILSCGNNLCNNKFKFGELNDSDGNEVAYDGNTISSEFSVVKSGSTVIIKSYDNTSTYARMFEYDKSGKVVTSYSIASLGTTSKTLNENTKYIKLKYQGKQSNIKVQLEEGAVATPYTPYEETRCDIKLPCQLEKWDRLYFDKVENAWCVDKGIVKIMLGDILPSIQSSQNGETTYYFSFDLESKACVRDVFCNVLPFNTNTFTVGESESVCVNGGLNALMGRVKSDKVGAYTKEAIQSYLKKVGAYALVSTINPQKIVLPQSEQIKLNSFANKTHIYTISGDVDVIVKATVSKSLASTVQANTHEINILNGKIENIQGLKESQDFTYETDKGYLVCKDTQNGVVKDLKVCGKSLVNKIGKCDSSKWSKDSVGSVLFYRQSINDFNFEIGKNYTIVVFGMSSNVNPSLMKIVGVNNTSAITGNNFVFNFTVNTREESPTPYIHLYKKNMDVPIVESDYINAKMVILDGNHAQNPPNGYFEGIASVGNGNEIEVSTVNTGNIYNNIFYKDFRIGANGTPIVATGHNITDFLKIYNFDKYYIKSEGTETFLATFDKDKNFIKRYLNPKEFTVSSGEEYIRYSANSSLENLIISPLSINPSHIKQDKKTILFKDTDNTWKPVTNLRGIDLNSCDVIDSNKNTLTRNCDGKLFNGSENWIKANADKTNTYLYQTKIENIAITKILCDKYKQVEPDIQWNNDEECISLNGDGYIGIRSKKKTIEEFKIDLSVNNIEIVFKLKQGEQFEVNPLELESFDNITLWLILSGVIAPPANFKITSSLPNFVKSIQDQVRQLQDQVYKTNVANLTVALNTLDTKLRLDRLEAPQM